MLQWIPSCNHFPVRVPRLSKVAQRLIKMRLELDSLIQKFRSSQDLAMDLLHGTLGIPMPSSSFDWVKSCREQIQTALGSCKIEGLDLRPHGYGIEVVHPDFQIDFDYGPNGEIDCFDEWRLALFRHLSDSRPNPVGQYDDIRNWIQEAVSSEELIVVAETSGTLFRYPGRLRGQEIFDRIKKRDQP